MYPSVAARGLTDRYHNFGFPMAHGLIFTSLFDSGGMSCLALGLVQWMISLS